jgi:hypothetical protein
MVHVEYINPWHAMRDHIFIEWYPPIKLDLYMSWYMNITKRFIKQSLERVIRCPYDTLRHPTSNLYNYESCAPRYNRLVCMDWFFLICNKILIDIL